MSSVFIGAQSGTRGDYSLKVLDPQCNSCEFLMVQGEVYQLTLNRDEWFLLSLDTGLMQSARDKDFADRDCQLFETKIVSCHVWAVFFFICGILLLDR